MKFIEVGMIALAVLFLIPGIIGVIDELTGVISSNLNLTPEVELVLDAYPIFLLLPVGIIIMLFKGRRSGGGDLEI